MNRAEFKELMERHGIEVCDYSARGMYGDSCPSVTDSAVAEVFGHQDNAPDEICATLFRASKDALGKGVIYYWRQNR